MQSRRMIDCFPFHNEIDLLLFRVQYLFDTVDMFLIVEATRTHRGVEKTLQFPLYQERFQPYRHKIKYVVVKNLPSADIHSNAYNMNWLREMQQRHSILNALETIQIQSNDIIISSDVDEIPDRYALHNIRIVAEGLPLSWIFRLEMDMYCFNVNRKRSAVWSNAIVCSYPFLESYTCSKEWPFWGFKLMALRHLPNSTPTWKHGGWHFSFFGSPAFIQQKISSYAHSERDTSSNTLDTIQNRIDGLQDPSIDNADDGHRYTHVPIQENRYLPDQWYQLLDFMETYSALA